MGCGCTRPTSFRDPSVTLIARGARQSRGMATMPPAPGPQHSPDGKFFWNGQQWVAVSSTKGLTPGKSFIGGFFGYSGAACASCIVGIVVLVIVFGVVFSACAEVTHQLTKSLPTPCPLRMACAPTSPANPSLSGIGR